ncbi:MAG: hypothetical protein AAF587_19740 [Bacteroidota bacterium]
MSFLLSFFRFSTLLLLWIVWTGTSLFCQEPAMGFPHAWIGTWTGDLEIYQGPELKQKIPMALTIEPTDSSDSWKWVLDYGRDSKDVRNYLLLLVDVKNGLYSIDEQNSIILEARLLGNTLTSRFLVNHSLLLVSYHFREEEIKLEIFVGPDDKGTTTGTEVEGVDIIESWPLSTKQQAILKKE